MKFSRCPSYLVVIAIVGIVAISACGGTTKSTEASGSASADATLDYVAFGDSWPEGAHCNGCQTFAHRYGTALKKLSGKQVVVTDLLGSQEPGIVGDQSETSATLLESLRSNKTTRSATKRADVILIATGPNEFDEALTKSLDGTCGGPTKSNCIEATGRMWAKNFGAILDEIDSLRAGRPTAVRLVSAANVFVSEEGINEGLPKNFATTNGAKIFELLAQAMCDAAKDHDAQCVDVRPILNGPSLNQSVDENSDATMQAVTDALVAKGLPELS